MISLEHPRYVPTVLLLIIIVVNVLSPLYRTGSILSMNEVSTLCNFAPTVTKCCYMLAAQNSDFHWYFVHGLSSLIFRLGSGHQRPKGVTVTMPWGQQGPQLGPTGPRWAPCWPHKPCYLGRHRNYVFLRVTAHNKTLRQRLGGRRPVDFFCYTKCYVLWEERGVWDLYKLCTGWWITLWWNRIRFLSTLLVIYAESGTNRDCLLVLCKNPTFYFLASEISLMVSQ